MTRLWLREVKLTVSGSGGDLDLSGLKIEWSVSKSLGSKQNTATISVYNLTPSHRNALGDEFKQIELTHRYKGAGTTVLFRGQIRDKGTSKGTKAAGKDGPGGGGTNQGVKTTQETADVKTVIECGDGDEGVNKGAVSKTFKKGTKPRELIEHLVQNMPGVRMGQMVGLDDLPAFKRPVSLWGWSFRELDTLGRQFGFYWSIQNGEFQAVKADQALPGPIRLSAETGMLGIPELTDKGVKVRALPIAGLDRAGCVIDVRSDFLDEGSGRDKRASDAGGGLFRVASLQYTGSNRDNDNHVDIEANRMSGRKVTK